MNDIIKKRLAKLQKPAIHLNGSSKETLASGYNEVACMLDDAVTAMFKLTAPHPRDYYVYPDAVEALKRAEDEHKARVARILGVMEELQALSLYCRNGGKVD